MTNDVDSARELAALRERIAAIEGAVRGRDDFIAIAAHELRNPMQPILGIAELALSAANKAPQCPPQVVRLLSQMQGLVENYIQRATRLLEVTRIAADNLRIEPSCVDLSQMVTTVCETYRPAARRVGSELEPHIAENVVAEVDRIAMEQIIDNLLSNALKFGAGKPIAVRLQADAREACLEVRDYGVGMSLEQQQRVFERFEQVVGSHRGAGFGVGLWVTGRLVTAMGGRMAVSSQPGAGSAFTVTLPLTAAEPSGATHE